LQPAASSLRPAKEGGDGAPHRCGGAVMLAALTYFLSTAKSEKPKTDK
jgi:hypothetical protein